MGPEPDLTSDVPGMGIWGWMSPAELRWLGEQAARMDSVVEIGCLHGRSAFALLTACPGPVYCIDPWNDEADASYPSFMGNCGHFPNLRAVRARSLGAIGDILVKRGAEAGVTGAPPVDMVFIDGAHAYESVLADICAWLPHTTALICGHDYSKDDQPGYPGVAQAVDEVFGDQVRVADGTAIWSVNLDGDWHIAEALPSGPRTWTDEYGHETTYDFDWGEL